MDGWVDVEEEDVVILSGKGGGFIRIWRWREGLHNVCLYVIGKGGVKTFEIASVVSSYDVSS